MKKPIININDLQFRWASNKFPSLTIQNLEIISGDHVFIHGPSGSGKSTLLGILGGVNQPQSGNVNVLGKSLYALPRGLRDRFRADHIGFIFQQFNLLPYLSVMDNVLLSLNFSERRTKNISGNRTTEAKRILASLDLSHSLWGKSVTNLSVGQQQRVAAARALIGRPDIIIADEPTSSLDADRQSSFMNLLRGECVAAGSTLIFVSHDERLAASFDRKISLAEINKANVTGD